MNWDVVAAVGDFVGAIAIVLTLVYLAVQIRQNTRSGQSAALEGSIERIDDSRKSIYESSEVTAIYNRGLRNYEDLDENELLRLSALQEIGN